MLWLPYRFFGAPTIQFFGDAIPTGNAVLAIAHNNRVESRTEHASLLCEQLALFVRASPLSDIAKDQDCPQWRSIGTYDGGTAIVDRYIASGPSDEHRVVG